MSGRRAVQYRVTPSGSVALNGVRSAPYGSTVASEALRAPATVQRPHPMQAEHARTVARALDAHGTLTAALAAAPALATAFPAGNTLADQLRMAGRVTNFTASGLGRTLTATTTAPTRAGVACSSCSAARCRAGATTAWRP